MTMDEVMVIQQNIIAKHGDDIVCNLVINVDRNGSFTVTFKLYVNNHFQSITTNDSESMYVAEYYLSKFVGLMVDAWGDNDDTK